MNGIMSLLLLGLKSEYTVKFGMSPQDFDPALGKSHRLRPYFAVNPSSRPNMDTLSPPKGKVRTSKICMALPVLGDRTMALPL